MFVLNGAPKKGLLHISNSCKISTIKIYHAIYFAYLNIYSNYYVLEFAKKLVIGTFNHSTKLNHFTRFSKSLSNSPSPRIFTYDFQTHDSIFTHDV